MACSRGCCPTQRDHYKSVAFGASATPFRRAEAAGKTQMEGRWDKDMPAYKRLRDDGLQPPHIDGCAELESRAEHQTQIEMGMIGDPKKVAEGDRLSKELGVSA